MAGKEGVRQALLGFWALARSTAWVGCVAKQVAKQCMFSNASFSPVVWPNCALPPADLVPTK